MPKKEESMIALSKKPKGVTVIEGFPGFGLVATIATGFLLDHLKCEKIGTYYFTHIPASLAVHGCKIVDPVGVYYNKKYNVVVIHAISPAIGIEWEAADLVLNICKQLQAKELITIEGVGSAEIGDQPKAFYYSTDSAKAKKLEKAGTKCLGEGVIVGVTASLLMKIQKPMTALFAETASQLPDSKAAAKIIETIDKYLGLKVDYKPLLKQAVEFEGKIKGILEKTMKSKEQVEKKQLSYMG